MASFLSALGRARPADQIQNFLGKQKAMAVQDLNMQSAKQGMDIQARKEKTEVDALNLETARKAKTMNIKANPMFRALHPEDRETTFQDMLSNGIIDSEGNTTRGAAEDYVTQLESDDKLFKSFTDPINKRNFNQLDMEEAKLMELQNAPKPNPQAIEAQQLKVNAAMEKAGQVSSFTADHLKKLQAHKLDMAKQEDAQAHALALEKLKQQDSTSDEGKTYQLKIKDLMAQNPGLSKQEATGLMTGTIKVIPDPVSGIPYLVDSIKGTKKTLTDEDQINIESVITDPKQETLFKLADLTAGPVSAIQAGVSVPSGIVGGPVASETVQARQTIVTSKNELIKALSINRRYPVTEQQRIEKEINIEPRIFDNPKLLRARMISIDKSLKVRMNNAAKVAYDPNMPIVDRREAKKEIHDLSSFIDLMGVPPIIDNKMSKEDKQAIWDDLNPGDEFLLNGILKVKP